jgi:hypothetical protein
VPIGAVFEGRPSLSIAILAAIHSRDDFRLSPVQNIAGMLDSAAIHHFPSHFLRGCANLRTLIAAHGMGLLGAPRIYFKYSFPHLVVLGHACGAAATVVGANL